MFELEGIVPPLITPLHPDETVDEAALERQLGRMLDAGIRSLFFLGSTGEQPALRDTERVKAIKVGRRVVGGKATLVVGTMASSTARAVDNIRAAEAAGADAVAVTPPHYYNSRGEEEQLAHYRACAAATGLPVVIYNIPLTTKVMLAPETILKIAELPNVAGIKDSSNDFVHFLKVLSLLRKKEGFSILIGSPLLAGAAVLYGADGAVASIANVDPRTMQDVYASALAKNPTALQKQQERVNRLMAMLAFGAPIVCLKTALELLGVCSHIAAAPLQPLDDAKRGAINEILVELGLL